ncbi:hypothetical protein ACWEQ3_44775 [Streptomyces mirabilis]
MTQHEPHADRPVESVGEAVWEHHLPWQMAPLDEAGELGSAVDGVDETHGSSGSTGAGDPTTLPDQRRAAARPDGPTAQRSLARISLTKPVLAGAAALGALLLAGPLALLGEDGAAHPADAGTSLALGDHLPDLQYPETGNGTHPPLPSSGPRPMPMSSTGVARRSADTQAMDAPRQESVAAISPVRTLSAKTRPLSFSREAVFSQPNACATPQTWTTTVIHGTSVLHPGQSWTTNRITLAFQANGDLVIFDKCNNPLWRSGTAGEGALTVFQADGNFVVYTKNGATAWSSRTDGRNGAQLVLQADGNVTITSGASVLWASGTVM